MKNPLRLIVFCVAASLGQAQAAGVAPSPILKGEFLGSAAEELTQGPSAAVAGATAQVQWEIERATTSTFKWANLLAGSNYGAPSVPAWSLLGLSQEFTGTSPLSSPGEGVVLGVNGVASYGCATCGVNGLPFDVVPLAVYGVLNASNASVVGENIVITGNASGLSNLAFNGLEIDVVIGGASNTFSPNNTQGLVIQAGNWTYSRAVSIGSFGGLGGWKDGVDIFELDAGGAAINFEGSMTTSEGVYCQATFYVGCIALPVGQAVVFGYVGGNVEKLLSDGTNLIARVGSAGGAGFIVQSNNGATNYAALSASGLTLAAGENVAIGTATGVSCTVNTPAHLTVVGGVVMLCN